VLYVGFNLVVSEFFGYLNLNCICPMHVTSLVAECHHAGPHEVHHHHYLGGHVQASLADPSSGGDVRGGRGREEEPCASGGGDGFPHVSRESNTWDGGWATFFCPFILNTKCLSCLSSYICTWSP
jgi:hypothetical protein